MSVSPEAGKPFSTALKSCQMTCCACAQPTFSDQFRVGSKRVQTLTKGDWNLFRRVAWADDERGVVEAQVWDELLQMELGSALQVYLASVAEHC